MSPQSSCVHTHEASPSTDGIQGALAEQEQFGNSLSLTPAHHCCPTAGRARSVRWHLPVYPLGSFLLQLASTKSAWLRMGGRPRACETSQKGTARFRGRT